MKIYNSNAPRSQNFYWSIQDDDPAMERMASSILLYYIQRNGQENKKRCEVLAAAANKLGFKIEVVEVNGDFQFKVPNKEVEFDKMRQEIRSIRRGNYENEVGQIYRILKKYQKKTVLGKFFSWLKGK